MSTNYAIIDPRSMSFDTVKADLVDYLNSLPDSQKWKDYYESGAGTTQVELLAGLGVYLGWHSLGARRESYLDQARLYTSAVSICNILGYPVNRLASPRLQITFTNPYSTYWDRENPIFLYKNNSISLLHSQTIPYGTHTMEFVMGEWKTTTVVSFYNLMVLDEGVDNNDYSDTVELFVNGSAMPIVKYSDEMLPTNMLLRTYIGGVLLIFGDGVLGYKVRVNDEIKFNYINTLGPINVLTINPLEITKNLNCTVSDVQILTPGYHKDELEKLAVAAPGYFQAKKRMVTGVDHDFIFLAYSGSLISTSHEKDELECCTIYLCYLFDDEHFISTTEKDSMQAYLDDFKVVGARLIIVNPIKVGVEMKMTLVVTEDVSQADIEAQVRAEIQKYVMKLGNVFHLGEITTQISQVPGVIRVYMQRPVSDISLDYRQYLKLVNLEVVVTSDFDYVASVNPDNNGYWKFLKSSTNTGVTLNKLVDTAGAFEVIGVQVGALIANMDAGLKAYVTAVDSNTQVSLSRDIFGVTGQKYELYNEHI
jgi:hypothetical protein